MAGTIVADTLTHSTAGSIATNYVVNGSLKAWVGASSAAVQQQSLNFSSSTDNGTGDYTHTLTNAASYDIEDGGLQVSAGGGIRFARYSTNGVTTTNVQLLIHNHEGVSVDGEHNISFAGDLA